MTIEVCKTKFFLSFEEFVVVFDLPITSSLFISEDYNSIEDFDFLTSYQSLLIDPSTGHKFSFTMGLMNMNVRLIYYVVTCVLFPWKFNLRQVSKADMVITWLLANKIETNWVNGAL